MKKLIVWDHANISKESYDKEKIIRKYYVDMKARGSVDFGPIYCLLCLWDKFSLSLRLI